MEVDKPASDASTSEAYETAVATSTGDLCGCLVRLYELISARNEPTLYRAELFLQCDPEQYKDPQTGFYASVKTSSTRTAPPGS